MAVMHLHIKFGADIFDGSGVIVIFPKFKMAVAAILDFQIVWIWPFRRIDSVVFVLRTKFGSNICYSHWDRRIYASDFYLMTSRELPSGFKFWSRGHIRMVAWFCTIFGIGGPLVDVIKCADFFIDQFRGIDFVGGWNLPIPIGIEGRR